MLSLNAANPWIRSAHDARRRPSAWMALSVAALVTIMTVALLPPPVSDWLPIMDGDGVLAVSVNRAALYILLFAGFFATALIGVVWERRPIRVGAWTFPPSALLGFGVGFGSLMAALAITYAAGAAHLVTDTPQPSLAPIPGVLAAALLVLLQCWAEEALFRGWLQPLLCDRWGAWAGLGVTTVLFGVAHSFRTPSPIAVMNATLAGLLFGLLALRTGGLAAPIAAHFGYNWAEQSIFGLTPNPGVDALGSIFNFDLAGPAIFSGGADELNGSISVSISLGLLILGLLAAGLGARAAALAHDA